MSEAFVEIRDYTIEAEWFDRYKEWAVAHAAPWLLKNMDVIDFWIDDGTEAEVAGSAPSVSPNGQANVCWIIRWPNQETRRAAWKALGENEEWAAIWAKHPNPDAYLQMNARFMKPALDAA